MAKIPFSIKASKQGNRGLIRITGTIGLDTNADLFRSQIDSLINDGIKDVHLYINSEGGSCFDAAEIVNIIQSSFNGRITGEGGAIVASAATFIALHCNTFTMPENGMFMIHKPSGGKEGNVRDLESYTKLLRDIENQYYNVYKSRAIDPKHFEQQWNSGDWWLTAQEAKENGFITDIKGQASIDEKTVAIITACGCPSSKFPSIKKVINKDINEDLLKIIDALDLPSDASLKQILEAIAVLKGEETPEKAVQTALKAGCIGVSEQSEFLVIARTNPQTFAGLMRKRKIQANADVQTKISDSINTAIFDKRIVATAANDWRKLFDLDFDIANAALNQLSPIQKVQFNLNNKSSKECENRSNWTLDDYRKNDPKALQCDPNLYSRLLEKEDIK